MLLRSQAMGKGRGKKRCGVRFVYADEPRTERVCSRLPHDDGKHAGPTLKKGGPKSPGGKAVRELLADPMVFPTGAMRKHEQAIAESLERNAPEPLRDSLALLGGAALTMFAEDTEIDVAIDGGEVERLSGDEVRAIGHRLMFRHMLKIGGKAIAGLDLSKLPKFDPNKR